MNDHLEAINENTAEINSNMDYMVHLEEMIMKLKERLDDMDIMIASIAGDKVNTADDYKNIVLSSKEQEIFYILYSREGDLLDYREVSKSLGLTEQLVIKHISAMISKGIPIIKKYFDDKVYLVLDADFRNLQAKENVIKFRKV
jgi:hypothetical protein